MSIHGKRITTDGSNMLVLRNSDISFINAELKLRAEHDFEMGHNAGIHSRIDDLKWTDESRRQSAKVISAHIKGAKKSEQKLSTSLNPARRPATAEEQEQRNRKAAEWLRNEKKLATSKSVEKRQSLENAKELELRRRTSMLNDRHKRIQSQLDLFASVDGVQRDPESLADVAVDVEEEKPPNLPRHTGRPSVPRLSKSYINKASLLEAEKVEVPTVELHKKQKHDKAADSDSDAEYGMDEFEQEGGGKGGEGTLIESFKDALQVDEFALKMIVDPSVKKPTPLDDAITVQTKESRMKRRKEGKAYLKEKRREQRSKTLSEREEREVAAQRKKAAMDKLRNEIADINEKAYIKRALDVRPSTAPGTTMSRPASFHHERGGAGGGGAVIDDVVIQRVEVQEITPQQEAHLEKQLEEYMQELKDQEDHAKAQKKADSGGQDKSPTSGGGRSKSPKPFHFNMWREREEESKKRSKSASRDGGSRAGASTQDSSAGGSRGRSRTPINTRPSTAPSGQQQRMSGSAVLSNGRQRQPAQQRTSQAHNVVSSRSAAEGNRRPRPKSATASPPEEQADAVELLDRSAITGTASSPYHPSFPLRKRNNDPPAKKHPALLHAQEVFNNSAVQPIPEQQPLNVSTQAKSNLTKFNRVLGDLDRMCGLLSKQTAEMQANLVLRDSTESIQAKQVQQSLQNRLMTSLQCDEQMELPSNDSSQSTRSGDQQNQAGTYEGSENVFYDTADRAFEELTNDLDAPTSIFENGGSTEEASPRFGENFGVAEEGEGTYDGYGDDSSESPLKGFQVSYRNEEDDNVMYDTDDGAGGRISNSGPLVVDHPSDADAVAAADPALPVRPVVVTIPRDSGRAAASSEYAFDASDLDMSHQRPPERQGQRVRPNVTSHTAMPTGPIRRDISVQSFQSQGTEPDVAAFDRYFEPRLSSDPLMMQQLGLLSDRREILHKYSKTAPELRNSHDVQVYTATTLDWLSSSLKDEANLVPRYQQDTYLTQPARQKPSASAQHKLSKAAPSNVPGGGAFIPSLRNQGQLASLLRSRYDEKFNELKFDDGPASSSGSSDEESDTENDFRAVSLMAREIYERRKAAGLIPAAKSSTGPVRGFPSFDGMEASDEVKDHSAHHSPEAVEDVNKPASMEKAIASEFYVMPSFDERRLRESKEHSAAEEQRRRSSSSAERHEEALSQSQSFWDAMLKRPLMHELADSTEGGTATPRISYEPDMLHDNRRSMRYEEPIAAGGTGINSTAGVGNGEIKFSPAEMRLRLLQELQRDDELFKMNWELAELERMNTLNIARELTEGVNKMTEKQLRDAKTQQELELNRYVYESSLALAAMNSQFQLDRQATALRQEHADYQAAVHLQQMQQEYERLIQHSKIVEDSLENNTRLLQVEQLLATEKNQLREERIHNLLRERQVLLDNEQSMRTQLDTLEGHIRLITGQMTNYQEQQAQQQWAMQQQQQQAAQHRPPHAAQAHSPIAHNQSAIDNEYSTNFEHESMAKFSPPRPSRFADPNRSYMSDRTLKSDSKLEYSQSSPSREIYEEEDIPEEYGYPQETSMVEEDDEVRYRSSPGSASESYRKRPTRGSASAGESTRSVPTVTRSASEEMLDELARQDSQVYDDDDFVTDEEYEPEEEVVVVSSQEPIREAVSIQYDPASDDEPLMEEIPEDVSQEESIEDAVAAKLSGDNSQEEIPDDYSQEFEQSKGSSIPEASVLHSSSAAAKGIAALPPKATTPRSTAVKPQDSSSELEESTSFGDAEINQIIANYQAEMEMRLKQQEKSFALQAQFLKAKHKKRLAALDILIKDDKLTKRQIKDEKQSIEDLYVEEKANLEKARWSLNAQCYKELRQFKKLKKDLLAYKTSPAADHASALEFLHGSAAASSSHGGMYSEAVYDSLSSSHEEISMQQQKHKKPAQKAPSAIKKPSANDSSAYDESYFQDFEQETQQSMLSKLHRSASEEEQEEIIMYESSRGTRRGGRLEQSMEEIGEDLPLETTNAHSIASDYEKSSPAPGVSKAQHSVSHYEYDEFEEESSRLAASALKTAEVSAQKKLSVSYRDDIEEVRSAGSDEIEEELSSKGSHDEQEGEEEHEYTTDNFHASASFAQQSQSRAESYGGDAFEEIDASKHNLSIDTSRSGHQPRLNDSAAEYMTEDFEEEGSDEVEVVPSPSKAHSVNALEESLAEHKKRVDDIQSKLDTLIDKKFSGTEEGTTSSSPTSPMAEPKSVEASPVRKPVVAAAAVAVGDEDEESIAESIPEAASEEEEEGLERSADQGRGEHKLELSSAAADILAESQESVDASFESTLGSRRQAPSVAPPVAEPVVMPPPSVKEEEHEQEEEEEPAEEQEEEYGDEDFEAAYDDEFSEEEGEASAPSPEKPVVAAAAALSKSPEVKASVPAAPAVQAAESDIEESLDEFDETKEAADYDRSFEASVSQAKEAILAPSYDSDASAEALSKGNIPPAAVPMHSAPSMAEHEEKRSVHEIKPSQLADEFDFDESIGQQHPPLIPVKHTVHDLALPDDTKKKADEDSGTEDSSDFGVDLTGHTYLEAPTSNEPVEPSKMQYNREEMKWVGEDVDLRGFDDSVDFLEGGMSPRARLMVESRSSSFNEPLNVRSTSTTKPSPIMSIQRQQEMGMVLSSPSQQAVKKEALNLADEGDAEEDQEEEEIPEEDFEEDFEEESEGEAEQQHATLNKESLQQLGSLSVSPTPLQAADVEEEPTHPEGIEEHPSEPIKYTSSLSISVEGEDDAPQRDDRFEGESELSVVSDDENARTPRRASSNRNKIEVSAGSEDAVEWASGYSPKDYSPKESSYNKKDDADHAPVTIIRPPGSESPATLAAAGDEIDEEIAEESDSFERSDLHSPLTPKRKPVGIAGFSPSPDKTPVPVAGSDGEDEEFVVLDDEEVADAKIAEMEEQHYEESVSFKEMPKLSSEQQLIVAEDVTNTIWDTVLQDALPINELAAEAYRAVKRHLMEEAAVEVPAGKQPEEEHEMEEVLEEIPEEVEASAPGLEELADDEEWAVSPRLEVVEEVEVSPRLEEVEDVIPMSQDHDTSVLSAAGGDISDILAELSMEMKSPVEKKRSAAPMIVQQRDESLQFMIESTEGSMDDRLFDHVMRVAGAAVAAGGAAAAVNRLQQIKEEPSPAITPETVVSPIGDKRIQHLEPAAQKETPLPPPVSEALVESVTGNILQTLLGDVFGSLSDEILHMLESSFQMEDEEEEELVVDGFKHEQKDDSSQEEEDLSAHLAASFASKHSTSSATSVPPPPPATSPKLSAMPLPPINVPKPAFTRDEALLLDEDEDDEYDFSVTKKPSSTSTATAKSSAPAPSAPPLQVQQPVMRKPVEKSAEETTEELCTMLLQQTKQYVNDLLDAVPYDKLRRHLDDPHYEGRFAPIDTTDAVTALTMDGDEVLVNTAALHDRMEEVLQELHTLRISSHNSSNPHNNSSTPMPFHKRTLAQYLPLTESAVRKYVIDNILVDQSSVVNVFKGQKPVRDLLNVPTIDAFREETKVAMEGACNTIADVILARMVIDTVSNSLLEFM